MGQRELVVGIRLPAARGGFEMLPLSGRRHRIRDGPRQPGRKVLEARRQHRGEALGITGRHSAQEKRWYWDQLGRRWHQSTLPYRRPAVSGSWARRGMTARGRCVVVSMRIDIWSDIVCPWCAIGKAHLDAALAEFEHADEVDIVWRSFELDPGAPSVREGEYSEMLARKYGTTVDGGQAMVRQMSERAVESGLHFALEQARSGNSFDAHRLVHLGAERGMQNQVKERFLGAYLSEGAAIGEHATLQRVAVDAGLDPIEVRGVLGSDAYGAAVRADESEALERAITGVPYFLIDGRFAIPGAQSAELILQTLRRAWRESHEAATVVGGGAACGPDGCAV